MAHFASGEVSAAMITFLRVAFFSWVILVSAFLAWLMVWLLERLT